MSFQIDCRWLDRSFATPLDATLCYLKIAAGDKILTRNRNEEDHQETDSILVSAWPFAAWLVNNWWRLLNETTGPSHNLDKREPSIEWKMSHNLLAADYGYLWPETTLVTDDREIQFCIADQQAGQIQLAHYIYPSNFRVDIDDFSNSCRDFLQKVADRLQSNFTNDSLCESIAQLNNEITNPEFAQYRKVEAMLGYDPDMAPESLVEYGIATVHKYGLDFFRDLASAINVNFVNGNTKDKLERITLCANNVREYGTGAIFKLTDDFQPETTSGQTPWDYGRAMARKLRHFSGVSQDAKLTDEMLAEWFAIRRETMFETHGGGDYGLCRKKGQRLKIGFANESSAYYKENRRFFFARMTAACLAAKSDDWLAITPATTWGQRMQRAFAAELLAPIDAIRADLPDGEMNSGDIKMIANHFGASYVTIVHSLLNHKDIRREEADHLLAVA